MFFMFIGTFMVNINHQIINCDEKMKKNLPTKMVQKPYATGAFFLWENQKGLRKIFDFPAPGKNSDPRFNGFLRANMDLTVK